MTNPTIFPALIQNAALLLAMAFIYDLLTSRHQLGRWPLPVQYLIGTIVGVLGIIIMLSPWRYEPGIIFDTRSVLLGISGLFFGVIPTAVAMGMTAFFRLSQGGAAAWTGVAVILSTGTLGILWRHHRREALAELSWRELYCFGLLIHLVMLALMLTLPWDTAFKVLAKISLPVLLIYPLATALLGVLLVNRLRREGLAAQLLVSEERMRLFFERQIVGMAITSPAKGWLQVNEQLCRMLGYSREELFRTTWPGLTYPDDLQADLECFEQLLAGTINDYSLEKRFIRKDGGLVWTELSVGCVRDAGGAVTYVLALLVDITERKQAEETLRVFKLLVESASDAIGMSTPTGKHYYQNDAFNVLFGEIGEDPSASVYVDHRVGRDIFATIMAGRRWEGEVEMYAKDGRVVNILLRAYANKDADGRVISLVGIHTDITARRLAEQEQHRLQAQLLQAQKMESVGRLAGGVAHDFNNMLQTILGYCELSLGEVEATASLHENLEEIHKAALRSADLTRQLLAFARKQTASPKVLDLNDTVVGMFKMLQRLVGENIELAWLPGHELWKVKMDPSQVDQILANLAVNARDAIADVGRISIATENVQLDHEHCTELSECSPGDYVLLSVHDDGCGMDQETLAQIFEPFFTTKELGKGTGLGLATVYGIVRQNNGYLGVESMPDQGTTFRIYLPRFVAAPGESASAEGGEVPVSGTGTILLVEDEVAILKLGKSILEMYGYTVLATQSAHEALQVAREYVGPIQLLVADVVLPGMNGNELAKQVTALRPGMGCLYMSGYTADIIASHGVVEDGVRFIRKPFSVNEFARAVRQALREQAGLS